jgi:hypothetical protein
MLKLAKLGVGLTLLLAAGCSSGEQSALQDKCNGGDQNACQQVSQSESIGTRAEGQDGHPLRGTDTNAVLNLR